MSEGETAAAAPAAPSEREQVLEQYRAKIREHRETEARLKRMREDVKGLVARYQKTEDDLSALQSVGQIIGDVLKKLDNERFIVKASSGPRYVVGCRSRLNQDKLKPGTRVALDMTTLTIMRILPREVDPTVFHMQEDEEGGKKVSEIKLAKRFWSYILNDYILYYTYMSPLLNSDELQRCWRVE